MGKIDSNRCPYCNLYAESIVHLFFECVNIRVLWCKVKDNLSSFLNKNIAFDSKDIVIGYKIEEKNNTVIILVNKVILYVKYYIWNSRGNMLPPSYFNLREWLLKRSTYIHEIKEFIDMF